MSRFFEAGIRLPVAAIWLVLVHVGYRYTAVRWVSSVVAAVVAGFHLGALIGGLLEKWIAPPTGSVPVPFQGIVLGGLIGGALGAVLGLLCARNLALYWTLQYAAVAILVFMPLK